MSIYPICLLLLMLVLYVLCGTYIFPKFIESSNISPSDIPPMVNVIILPCRMMFSNFASFLITSSVAVFGVYFISIQKSFKLFMDKLLLKLPKVCDFVRNVNLAAYFNVLAVAYEAGVPINAALELSGNTITNSLVRNQAKGAEKLVGSGQELAKSFSFTNLVPPELNVLIASGEKAGRLGQMFRDVSIAIDKQLETATDRLTRAFEPVILLVLGIAVAYIAIAFFQMLGSTFGSMF